MYGICAKLFAPLLIAGAIAAAAPPAAKGNPQSCAARDQVLSHLAGQYDEAPVAMGLANNGGIIEVLRSSDSKTFTIIITMPDGQACMIAAGQSWESLPHRLAGGPGI